MNGRLTLGLVVCLGSLIGAAAPAMAGVADAIKVEVTQLASPVTYSATFTSTNRRKFTSTSVLDSFVVYRVDVTNQVGNTVNNVVFRGTTSVDEDPDVIEPVQLSATLASFESIDGSIACGDIGNVSVRCSVGTLRAGEGVTFWLYFLAPQNQNGVVDLTVPKEFVDFSYEALYSEGGNDSPGSQPNDSSGLSFATPVALGTPNPLEVRSGVPSNRETKVFTGNGLFAEPQATSNGAVVAPAIQTTVTIPAGASIADVDVAPTATIIQQPNPLPPSGVACANFLTCYASALDMPSVYTGGSKAGDPFLRIFVRIDASNIGKGVRITDITPTYENVAVSQCTFAQDGVTYQILPCWIDRKVIKNPQDPNEDGDFLWEFINDENGRYAFF